MVGKMSYVTLLWGIKYINVRRWKLNLRKENRLADKVSCIVSKYRRLGFFRSYRRRNLGHECTSQITLRHLQKEISEQKYLIELNRKQQRDIDRTGFIWDVKSVRSMNMLFTFHSLEGIEEAIVQPRAGLCLPKVVCSDEEQTERY